MARKSKIGQGDDGVTISKIGLTRLWRIARQQQDTGRIGDNQGWKKLGFRKRF